MRGMMVECEYCGRDDVVLYAWHADVWCADDLLASVSHTLPLTGSLEDSPEGRPQHADYSRPFIFQTPDGRVQDGKVRP